MLCPLLVFVCVFRAVSHDESAPTRQKFQLIRTHLRVPDGMWPILCSVYATRSAPPFFNIIKFFLNTPELSWPCCCRCCLDEWHTLKNEMKMSHRYLKVLYVHYIRKQRGAHTETLSRLHGVVGEATGCLGATYGGVWAISVVTLFTWTCNLMFLVDHTIMLPGVITLSCAWILQYWGDATQILGVG